MASLYVIRGKDNGQHFAIRGVSATLGREATNQIQVRDTEVSRKHARVTRTDDSSYEIADLDSSNGTYVNGRRVKEQVLRSGDRVQVGRTLMIFTGGPDIHSTHAINAVEIVAERSEDDLSQIRSSLDSQSSLARISPDSKRLSVAPYSSADASQTPEDHSESVPASESTGSGLELLFQVSQAINRTVDLSDLLNQVLDLIFDSIECDRGCILMNDDADQLTPIASLDRKTRLQGEDSGVRPPLTISRTILDHVCKSREGVLTSNAQDDARWASAESVAKLGVHEAMCVPMLGRYGFVGAIYVDTSMSPGTLVERQVQKRSAEDQDEASNEEQISTALFDKDHLKLMMAIAGQAALAIEDTQFYRAMIQSEKLAVMGQTIANLSHHIKNILQGVSGGEYLVDDGIKKQDWEVVSNGWASVKRNQDRITSLVMDMLSFSKEREPHLSTCDLASLINEVIQLARPKAMDAGAALKSSILCPNSTAECDSEGIHRALLNVVGNALDAVKDTHGAQVDVELSRQDGMVRITVVDNGPGIPEEFRSQLFVPFQSSKGSAGTGLGLPVTRKILREHGGDVTFTTQAGRGTAFVLQWPDREKPAPPDAPQTMPG
ncbi:MAG: ATP-binding protein [Aureliella sp.]